MFFVFRHPSRHKNHKRVIPLWVSCAGVLCLPQRRQKVGCKAECREVLAAASGAGPRQGRPHPGGGGVHPEAPPRHRPLLRGPREICGGEGEWFFIKLKWVRTVSECPRR